MSIINEMWCVMTERGLKIREAFRKKYGVDHPSQLPSVKEKIKQRRLDGAYDDVPNKIKRTLLKKYGNEKYVNVQKAKKTKLEKYGDENYNNREKMLRTNNEKYGMNVSPNTLKSTVDRLKTRRIGFGSEKYKEYLSSQNISNISQLPSVKVTKSKNVLRRTIHNLFFGNRLKSAVIPLFSENEYVGTDYDTMYKFKCNLCNHIFEDTLYSGNIPRCLICYPHQRFKSKIEDEIFEFILSQGVNVHRHNRTILDGNEIDILLPDHHFGVECDGIIWHSESFGKKSNKYHLHKTEIANNKGIDILHIWDWEWLNKKDIVQSMLRNKLKLNTTIYARKCSIKLISSNEKSDFIQNNHIQGNDRSSISIGLFHDSELVSVMTFVKSRFNRSYEYEISRFCNILGYNIVGGAGRLFSYFIKTYCPSSIISYCDRRYFTGKVYESIGMTFVAETPPSYHYFHKNKCVPCNRLHFQKHKLSSILPYYDDKLTEWENMQLNGYDRIWDCGHYKYTWESSNKQFKH
jgi:hypothetical protein